MEHSRFERTFSIKRHVDVLQHLHRIRPPPFLLRVEEDVPLLRYAPLDHIEQHRPKGLLRVRPNPDEEPVIELDCGGEYSSDTGSSADGDTTTEEVSEVRKTSELYDVGISRVQRAWAHESVLTFISRV